MTDHGVRQSKPQIKSGNVSMFAVIVLCALVLVLVLVFGSGPYAGLPSGAH